ncbi:MAG: hypothetical protein V7K32_27755 [Nostoc sp.]
MRESIKEGLATPIQECDAELDWLLSQRLRSHFQSPKVQVGA